MYERKYEQTGTKGKKNTNAYVKFPAIKDKLSNAPIKQQPVKSLKLERITKKNNIALSDLAKINKIQKQFAQMTKRSPHVQQTEMKSGRTQTRDEMRQSRLLLLKDISSEPPKKSGNNNLLSNLVLYTQPEKSAKTVNIPYSNITSSPNKIKKQRSRQKSKEKQFSPPSKKSPVISSPNIPFSDKNLHIAPPTQYKNPTELLKIDFVKMFIIEELLYYISKTRQRSKEQMSGFCRFYNENQDQNAYLIIEKVLDREKDYLQSIFYEKLGFYIFLILGTDTALHQQSSFLLNSLTGYLHTNNMIILDLMMQIVDYENFQISSQFHVYNTSRFNEARRLIKNNNEDKVNLLAKNNAHLLEIIKSILTDCGFDSLKNFVLQIIANDDVDLTEKIKEVSLMLISLDTILTSSIEKEIQQNQKKKPQPPFLPEKEKSNKYTLVLDMDQTLIHYFQRENDSNATVANSFLVRPHCITFLQEMNQHFELVIFTAAVKQYADTILDILDKKGLISHRLYRQHTRIQDYVSIKDLSMIGRDISKTIIIDNIQSNFKMQPRNGIAISTWIGDPEDQSLAKLIPVLKKIALDNVQDVRDGLEAISKFMESQIEKNEDINFEKLSLKGL